ncbi:MAG: hypothetical protein R3223_08190 [Longimicrobiales bacterium]|nr:hypothetical protein [Longimicrobiales bacterium]
MVDGLLLRARTGFAFAALIVLALVPAVRVQAQIPPDEQWATRTTENLRVTYPAEHPELGERTAIRAEAAYRLLSRVLARPPSGRIDVVVSDHVDQSNGWATVFPTNRVVVVAAPPVDGLSLAHFDDWLDLVLVHELAHVFHLDESGGPGAVVRAVFGRIPVVWPTFPGLLTPSWTTEGLATWYESGLTSAGRNRGSYFEMILRTAALEGAFEDLGQASGSSPVWPHGDRPYVYGGGFFDKLVERPDTALRPPGIPEFVQSHADRWLPFRLGASTEDAFNVEVDPAWDRWREEREEEARALRDSLASRAPLTRSERLTRHGRWALRPSPAPTGTGRLAYTRSDGTTDPQIHILPEGRKLTRTSGLADLSWTPDGEIVFSQLEYTDRYELRTDLYRVDGGGRVTRLTRDGRLDHPDVAPDGEVAVAIQWGEGTNRLVEVDLDDGGMHPLTRFRPDVHWAYPRISPDGGRIAVSRWRSGGLYDVVLLDREGRIEAEITRDRAVDIAPTWSPDGRWLLWSSDRSGIWNVVALPVEAARESDPARGLVQLTNVVTGALYPAVDPDGRWLYFSGYHADGWHIERIPFEPEAGLAPFPPSARVLPFDDVSFDSPTPSPTDPPADSVTDSLADSPVGASSSSPVARARGDSVPGVTGPYSPFPTLLPRYWLPDLAPAEDALRLAGPYPGEVEVLGFRVGASTSGSDLVGRHSYGARAGLTLGDGRFEGFGQYRYAGLGNPVLGSFVYQDWEAGPRFVTLESGGLQESVVAVERERGGGLTLGFLRRRFRDALGLTVSGSWVRQHRAYLSSGGQGMGDLRESTVFQPAVPDRDLVDVAVTLTGDHTRHHPFSISLEDGVRGHLTLRKRWDVALPDAYADVPDRDGSFREVLGEVGLYKAFSGPGFANHVIAARISGGMADGPDALAFHFEVGGNRGGPEPLGGLGLTGSDASAFPVRGFGEGVRFGRYAWSGSVEYRFPLWLIHQGFGAFPLHLDRMSGAVFLDAGNAWGPRIGTDPVLPFRNPRRDAVTSAGAELSTVFLPLWTGDVDLRMGVAVPLQGFSGSREPSLYVAFGSSF